MKTTTYEDSISGNRSHWTFKLISFNASQIYRVELAVNSSLHSCSCCLDSYVYNHTHVQLELPACLLPSKGEDSCRTDALCCGTLKVSSVVSLLTLKTLTVVSSSDILCSAIIRQRHYSNTGGVCDSAVCSWAGRLTGSGRWGRTEGCLNRLFDEEEQSKQTAAGGWTLIQNTCFRALTPHFKAGLHEYEDDFLG